jgi:hypothetical protein
MATGYGRAMWCTDQIRSGRHASGWRVVAQAYYRRLTTPRGTLRGGEEESAYGFDVCGYVGAVGEAIALRALPAQVAAELAKDDRGTGVSCEAAIATDADGLTSIVLTITATLADESDDFTLTLAVTSTTVTILGGLS